MDSIRKEIEAEIKRARLDKGRLYDLLLKIIDSGVGGGAGAQGPRGPQGPQGPQGPAGAPGASGVCKCTCTKEDKPKVVAPKDEKPSAKPVVKKTTTTTKKTSASST
jgi:hypothetical protein